RSHASSYQPLSAAGIHIYPSPEPFVLHSKFVLAAPDAGRADPDAGRADPEETDEGIRLKSHPLAAFGSSNLDMRSFGLNYESTMLVAQGDLFTEFNELAANSPAVSHELTLEEWNKRSVARRYIDNVMRLSSALQ